jgi:hypothetical protein
MRSPLVCKNLRKIAENQTIDLSEFFRQTTLGALSCRDASPFVTPLHGSLIP